MGTAGVEVNVSARVPKRPFLDHEEIEDDLLVARPFAAVGEDEDGFDLMLAEVSGAGEARFFVGEFAEGRGVLVVLDDVTRGDDVL